MHSFIRIWFSRVFGLAPLAVQAQETKPKTEPPRLKLRLRNARTFITFLRIRRAGKSSRARRVHENYHRLTSRSLKGIILRHQDGDSWDYVAIEHVGTKATVGDSRQPQMTPNRRVVLCKNMEGHL